MNNLILKLRKKINDIWLLEEKLNKLEENKSNLIFNFSVDWYFFNRDSGKHHRWHLVPPSPWPIFTACSVLILVMGFISWMHGLSVKFIFSMFGWGVIFVMCAMFLWFRDIHRENLLGFHTIPVERGLRTGFTLFILSEVMFFFSFFWAYFHVSLDPSIWTGNVWPPEGIVYFHISENINSTLSDVGAVSSTFYEYLNFDKVDRLDYKPELRKEAWGLDLISYDLRKVSRYLWLCDYVIQVTLIMGEFDTIPADAPEESEDEWTDLTLRALLRAEAFSQILFNNRDIGKLDIYPNFINPYIYADNSVWGALFAWYSDYKELNMKKMSIFVNLHDKGCLTNPFKIPLLNTAILLTSGATLTVAHYALRTEKFFKAMVALFFTIFLAFFFIISQLIEFVYSPFSIDDGIYGSVFFMLTGFHGFHVIVGTIFLSICFVRMHLGHFTRSNHFGFEAAIWYWHFVDVVWIFLYIFLYLWPSWYFFNESFWIRSGGSHVTFSAHIPLENLGVTDKSDIAHIRTNKLVKIKYLTAIATYEPLIKIMDQIDLEHGDYINDLIIKIYKQYFWINEMGYMVSPAMDTNDEIYSLRFIPYDDTYFYFCRKNILI